MAYSCSLHSEDDFFPARFVFMDLTSGDTMAVCPEHLLTFLDGTLKAVQAASEEVMEDGPNAEHNEPETTEEAPPVKKAPAKKAAAKKAPVETESAPDTVSSGPLSTSS